MYTPVESAVSIIFYFPIFFMLLIVTYITYLDGDIPFIKHYPHIEKRGEKKFRAIASLVVIAISILAVIQLKDGLTSLGVWLVLGVQVIAYWLVVPAMVRDCIAYMDIPKVHENAPQWTREDEIKTFIGDLDVHPSFKVPLGLAYKKYLEENIGRQSNPFQLATDVNAFIKMGSPLLVYDEAGETFASTLAVEKYTEEDAEIMYPKMVALGDMLGPVKSLRVRPQLPNNLRNEHHQIIGGIGHGKTSTLISLILDDVEEDAAMVVIDSQGDLIENLATRLPQDRVILVSPNCPPAMNPFVLKDRSDGAVSRALTMLNYVFSTGGLAMTSKQSMVYSYLSRLCMTIPGASIRTFRQLLNPESEEQFAPHIARLDQDDQDFFKSYYQKKSNQYSDTREEINVRISGLLQTKMFVSMFAASDMKLDIPQALQDGKIILVSTKSTDTGDASSVIGRLFIAHVMQAVRNRAEHDRKRVYLYVDEFADYADDSKMLTDCFSQGRKYNLAMVICFQILKPLNETVRAFISGCTSIKFAGGVSPDDIVYMAKQMETDEETIRAQPKLTFLAFIKGYGVIPWKADPKRLKKLPVQRSYADIEAEMRELYGEDSQTREVLPGEAPFVDRV